MKDISQVLQENSFAVKNLLRRYHVYGPLDMDTVQEAYKKHGSEFMMKLLAIITPQQSGFTSPLSQIPTLSGTVPTIVDTKTLAAATKAESVSTSNGWSFWDNLLNAVSKTGEAIGQFKIDSAGNAISESQQQPITATQFNPKTLYIAAGILAFIIILILIFKK
jgi:hypothetical protein